VSASGLIVAAPASGHGKTLISAGILRALRRRGRRVAAAKTGPDYIDPGFLAMASGSPAVNLDAWGMRHETLAGLVAADAELIVCEGTMGLFDGAGPDGEAGSTAALARITGWPVVLVVDARGQGASAAALVAGFVRHDPRVPVVGVVFNRVGSPRHSDLLQGAIERHLPGLVRLGCVPADPRLRLPERHLGLIPAAESAGAAAAIERAAALVDSALDLDRLVALARPAAISAAPAAGLPPLAARIAVARDDAFVFAYPQLLDGWRRQGAELAFFSPLADEAPPDEAAVFLPGGYPELHAGRLAAAQRFTAGLRHAADMGNPIYGECGGYMVLGEALVDAAGEAHAMAGLLPLTTSFADRRLHLGYRVASLVAAGPLGAAGVAFRGHEFHYATVLAEEAVAPLFRLHDASGRELGTGGLRRGAVFGSFVHLIDRA